MRSRLEEGVRWYFSAETDELHPVYGYGVVHTPCFLYQAVNLLLHFVMLYIGASPA